MAYFPHAYKQVFFGKNYTFIDTGKTDAIPAARYGFFDSKTWTAIPLAQADVALHPTATLVLPSTHTVDIIGSHGGYKETLKSKPIDPKYVRRFYKVANRTPSFHQIFLGYQSGDLNSIPTFEAGKQYLLRIDVKGSPALRFFTRNLYHTFDAGPGCTNNTCADPCDAPLKIDPTIIFLQWADQIKADPIFSKFITAQVVQYDEAENLVQINSSTYVEVTDQAVIPTIKAALILGASYMDTRFGNCSFDPSDHYEMEPLFIYPQLVDESGNPCQIPSLAKSETLPRTGEGYGETILRDLILANRYRQEPFHLDPRRRETEDINAVTLDHVPRTNYYDSFYLLYGVPRHSNPSSMHDTDQYLLQYTVFGGHDMTAFTNWLHAYLESAGNGVRLENLSSAP